MTPEQAGKVRQGIAARDDVAEAKLVTPEEGLKEFESLSGFGDALKRSRGIPCPMS